jgi:uncharacterized protein with HEPN domain
MSRDPRMLLTDVLEAAASIGRFRAGIDLSGYRADELIRAGVERKMEVIGEALNRLAREDPELVARVPDIGRIMGFRNVLAHGYDVVDDVVVWSAITIDLPELVRTVEVLLEGLDVRSAGQAQNPGREGDA